MPATNNLFKQLQISSQVHLSISQEFLPSTENNHFKSSQPHQAQERHKLASQKICGKVNSRWKKPKK